MKVVHEIYHPASASGGSTGSYVKRQGQEKSSGFLVDILIVIPDPMGGDTEAIHIEGDGACILDALYRAASVVETCGDVHVEDGEVVSDWRKKPEKIRGRVGK